MAETATYAKVKRPTPVLRHLPRSANVVYDILATSAAPDGRCSLTSAEICAIARISRQTVWRAMKRLTATGLIDIPERRRGRGRGNIFKVRIFSTGRKAVRNVNTLVRVLFPQKSVTPPYNPLRRNSLSRKFHHTSVVYPDSLKTAGRLMRAVRMAVEKTQLRKDEKQAILNTVGRMLFKEGRLKDFQQQPAAFAELLSLLASGQLPASPPAGSAPRRIYAWASFPRFILGKHLAGMAGLWEELKRKLSQGQSAKFSTEKCNTSPKGRSGMRYGVPDRSVTRGPSGVNSVDKHVVARPETGTAHGVYKLPPGWGRRYRRRTWSERGLTPSWASGGAT